MPSMLDKITDTLPSGYDAYAGYVGGRWPDAAAIAATHPGVPVLTIAVNATETADCLDVETGDATPQQAPGWLTQPDNGPFVYVSLVQAQTALNVLEAAGIKRSAFLLFTAHYTKVAHICGPGCGEGFTGQADGTQWNPNGPDGSDESLISVAFLDAIAGGLVVPTPPAPSPAPPTPEDQDVIKVYTTAAPLPSAQILVENSMRYRLINDDTEDLATAENIFAALIEPGVRTTLDGFGDPANPKTAEYFGITWPLTASA